MFDWARGSMLKKFLEFGIYGADWEPRGAQALKNWHSSWLLGLIEFTPQMSILDVGAATPKFMNYIHEAYGCEVHALDADSTTASKSHFGFPSDIAVRFPNVMMHVGLAGDDLLPAERFDLITCISTLEHTYDHDSPLLANRPMPHLHALRDMVRMLKPGGAFLMNWDLFLDNIPQNLGWDFEVDYRVLVASGMRMLSERRRLRNVAYMYSHPDTLFFDPITVLGFKMGKLRRGTSINILWQKPGHGSSIRLRPRPELEPYYFPDEETVPEIDGTIAPAAEATTEEIDASFRAIISRITDVLGRTDVDGKSIESQLAAR